MVIEMRQSRRKSNGRQFFSLFANDCLLVGQSAACIECFIWQGWLQVILHHANALLSSQEHQDSIKSERTVQRVVAGSSKTGIKLIITSEIFTAIR